MACRREDLRHRPPPPAIDPGHAKPPILWIQHPPTAVLREKHVPHAQHLSILARRRLAPSMSTAFISLILPNSFQTTVDETYQIKQGNHAVVSIALPLLGVPHTAEPLELVGCSLHFIGRDGLAGYKMDCFCSRRGSTKL